MDSYDKEPGIERANIKETRREDGKLQQEESAVLVKRVEETEIPGQEIGKWWRFQRLLCSQGSVMVTSICSKQEKPGWIKGKNAQGTVQCRVEGNMSDFFY